MSAALLLGRLNGVRACGEGRWVARCPAHDDSRPSLSIRELPDGRVLLHDFAGCSVRAVLAMLDLEMQALFPEQHRRCQPGARPNTLARPAGRDLRAA